MKIIFLVCVGWRSWSHPYKVLAFSETLEEAKKHIEETLDAMRDFHWKSNMAFNMILEESMVVEGGMSYWNQKIHTRNPGSQEWINV